MIPPILATLPLGLAVSFLTNEILKTASAAQDVMVEKESFNTLAKYLKDIHPVISNIDIHKDNGSPALRQILDSLTEELEKASELIDKCKTKSKIYLLMNCRTIVKEVQAVTRGIGETLDLLVLACADVSIDIREHAEQITQHMRAVEFQASETELRVMNKLETGVQEQRIDQGFANDLLYEICRAVGVPVEPSELRHEIASFKKEKEDAALNKLLSEQEFMEQVLAILSRADLAYSSEDSNVKYQKIRDISFHGGFNTNQPHYKSFTCPLSKRVMEDPVMVCNGQSYERDAIERWFADGNNTDPQSNQVLDNRSLRPNIPLRNSIDEWAEINYCNTIQKAKRDLRFEDETKQIHALQILLELCEKSHMTKDWIASEGLVEAVVEKIHLHSHELKKQGLLTLDGLIKNNDDNKEKVCDAGGVEVVVKCLGRGNSLEKPAAALLMELLKDDHARVKLEHSKTAFLSLVTSYLQERDTEVVRTVQLILDQLSDKDENIVKMAEANWCTPLIRRLCDGSDGSRLCMAKSLAEMDLTDENKQKIAQSAAIGSLVEILALGHEAKGAALGALSKLSSHPGVKKQIADAGGIPCIIDLVFYQKDVQMSLKELGAKILTNITKRDSVQFLVDAQGAPVTIAPFIHKILEVQKSQSSSQALRLHGLQMLLNIVSKPQGEQARHLVQTYYGIPMLLPLINQGTAEIKVREIAVRILSFLGENNGSSQIAEYLKREEMVDALLRLLQDDKPVSMQAAAAKILARLPANDRDLTVRLVKAKALPILVSLIRSNNARVKENALDALRHFTDPTDIESQLGVTELDIQPLLLEILEQGSSVAKERAALALRDFSLNALRVGAFPETRRCVCIPIRPSAVQLCKVHRRICHYKKIFCLLKAGAVGPLVSLFDDEHSKTVEAGVDALATLVSEADLLDRGAQVLHEAQAITPLIRLLSHPSLQCAEKAVLLLDSLFTVPRIKDMYGHKAQLPLAALASNTNLSLRKSARRVLARSELTLSH